MNADLGTIVKKIKGSTVYLRRYRALLFFIFIAIIYSFIIFRINALSGTEPDQAAIDKASQGVKQPHVNEATVQKIQELQDNSVNVQTLFDQARQNPFQE